ncbi:hypothetical protein SLE2022_034250 [Rubroshorea leprosula]
MKRVPLYPHQPNSMDNQAKARSKHQTLLEDYLELQKDFVSMKKKLQKKKQERETLWAEVRFLRRRHEYLTMLESQKLELEQYSVEPQDSKMLAKDNSHGADGTPGNKISSPPALNSAAVEEKGDRGNKKEAQDPLRVEKKRKGSLISRKKVEKKKISWQDPVALRI